MIFFAFRSATTGPASTLTEVAWCRSDLTLGWTAPIKPRPTWAPVPGRLPSEGIDTADVMRALNSDLLGQEVFTACPEIEAPWLRTLATGADIEPAFSISATSLDAMVAVAMTRAPAADVTGLVLGMTGEIHLQKNGNALDDVITHALRLGAAAVEASRIERGEEFAGQLRQMLVDRARKLLDQHGRGQ